MPYHKLYMLHLPTLTQLAIFCGEGKIYTKLVKIQVSSIKANIKDTCHVLLELP